MDRRIAVLCHYIVTIREKEIVFGNVITHYDRYGRLHAAFYTAKEKLDSLWYILQIRWINTQ